MALFIKLKPRANKTSKYSLKQERANLLEKLKVTAITDPNYTKILKAIEQIDNMTNRKFATYSSALNDSAKTLIWGVGMEKSMAVDDSDAILTNKATMGTLKMFRW